MMVLVYVQYIPNFRMIKEEHNNDKEIEWLWKTTVWPRRMTYGSLSHSEFLYDNKSHTEVDLLLRCNLFPYILLNPLFHLFRWLTETDITSILDIPDFPRLSQVCPPSSVFHNPLPNVPQYARFEFLGSNDTHCG